MISIIGLLGAAIVMFSNIPQLILFVRQGHAEGISVSGNWVGFVGVALRTIYLAYTTHMDVISLAPYFFALACILITFYYIYFPRKKSQ